MAWLLRFSLIASFLVVLCFASVAPCQTESATISGRVTDTSGAVISEAEVQLQSIERGTTQVAASNGAGMYSLPSVQPGQYHMTIRKVGFRQIDFVGLMVNVQDHIEKNFQLQVGSVSESITVSGGAPLVNTEDATVSTVVDRNFAENLPMNGRSFQTLIELTPGIALTATNFTDSGQFSVNGQRATANYWMLDGVSANIGIGANVNGNPGNGLSGSVGSFSALGGTNSLVSVDAMQEFRIQTSSYAPEFGRTPGGQISIVTRSGTNKYHGTAFDYLRNDVFDSNDWFATRAGLPKPEERQNDFGGTFSGPLLKNRTFFFFSYEGLRLRLPQTELTTVPDLVARQNASAPLQPYFNAFPLPNGAEVGNGAAVFNATFSNSSALDAYSIRLDHRLSAKMMIFGRYNYSPSNLIQRGFNGLEFLSVVSPARITTQTWTAGLTLAVSPAMANELRFNYSSTEASSSSHLDNFGGAVPLTSLPVPSPYSPQNAQFSLDILALQGGQGNGIALGKNIHVAQRQINVVDHLSKQIGSHTFKFGVDFRRLAPLFDPPAYVQQAIFNDVASTERGKLIDANIVSSRRTTFRFRNLGLYAQDTWRIAPRLTMTYGIRWDVDAAPATGGGPSLPAVTNFSDLTHLAIAAPGTPVYKTAYGSVAPRVGLAYQLSTSQNWQTVLRGGFGVFYDLLTSEIGNTIFGSEYPFGASTRLFGQFPLTAAEAAPPPITLAAGASILALDPKLRPPYTLQWNVALDQAIGRQQTMSASYVGASGKRLIQTELLFNPTPVLSQAFLMLNGGTSEYHALQIQYRRQMSHGLQALASYTWSHSIDTASAGSWGVVSNVLVPSSIARSNRGSSDFDTRNSFSVGLTYDLPAPKVNALLDTLLRGWSAESVVQAHSATPVDASDANFFQFNGGFYGDVRPDLVSGQPLYLHGPQYPGGKAFNPAAFNDPPSDPNTGNPTRQGDVPRNFLQGFGVTQWDFAVHRDIQIHDTLKLQFRAEMFNVVNHPNFGPPNGQFGTGGFGVSTQMLGRSLAGSGSAGNGGFSSLYQVGGPRSIQLALKLLF